MRVHINEGLRMPQLDTMEFLNGIVSRHPEAISFGPGRPADRFCDMSASLRSMDRFIAHIAEQLGIPEGRANAALGQYGATKGWICELIAAHVARDENIAVDPSCILVTCGAQEAMALVLRTLFRERSDVLLTSDPAYAGITGVAHMLGIPVLPVACGPNGMDLNNLEARIEKVTATGRVPRAIYDIPDFHNPTGSCMAVECRQRLLEIAASNDIIILEDSAYSAFAYDHPRRPSLKSLDERGLVVYIGSFSKTLNPGLRVGYVVAEQMTTFGSRFVDELSKAKSFMTVNTPALSQAVVGGVLLDNDMSLIALNAPKVAYYRARRDCMLSNLAGTFSDERVQWNRPAGGFFITLTLPFSFGTDEMEHCAGVYGVICTPMSYFSLAGDQDHRVRLSFSYVSDDQISEGCLRLARFIDDVV